MAINIIVAGPRGRMGYEAVQMITKEDSFRLVACLDHKHDGLNLGELEQFSDDLQVPIYTDIDSCLKQHQADVFVDLTTPEVGYKHTKTALEYKVRPVVGTTGFTDEQLSELKELSKQQQRGCIIAPNFAIGAVLMMKFSKMAAKYFPNVEIIEKHHDQKLDAPSGTAKKTAELIQDVRESQKQGHPKEEETLPGARGADMDGMRIHSMRLPGLVAHQEVIFGGAGQTLTISHDSMNRASFMDGIRECVNQVMDLEELVYGLENLL
ncbi:4-hydroxy-tetrahydrodipicolinate reductase [Oceanobacillus iheyensis]|uniref:4-hydroxy-tetrahydrodipicolinate reductase n=1 Tax=Oceanobacillus iheyensis (strain DSM 14371 / CIP 107618 / JCM 11309 / KCTC 3954 / HTE831) TaxID=221109 RepID=DAPB_OCEIH|nr:4-hydroxy-tetrahydrodipicolinate reductase [Oceanobacillus iheyensis]Q8EQD3.1 RecName: Full=4-hydroxy-tetrahydrodipicolinate reductase; Short=HTPA reductase [Oceanobacillus iheyensis HTE831]BAC13724.1 dihydrodipicolinate reductase [Oceanobacillus iheyensis HTE831]